MDGITRNQLVRPPMGCMVYRTHSRFFGHSCSYLKSYPLEGLWFGSLIPWNVRFFEYRVSEKLLEKGSIGPKENFEFSVGFLNGFQLFFSGIFSCFYRAKKEKNGSDIMHQIA